MIELKKNNLRKVNTLSEAVVMYCKLDEAVEKLTNMINTGLTGHVVITDNEIMIMDTTDKDTAVEVWRYNINGFGYSNTGYNGPFIGLTKDGKLLVTEATTNKFTAALINTEHSYRYRLDQNHSEHDRC